MILKIVHISVLIAIMSISVSAQSWPGVDYSYVRVGNYNLNGDLGPNHQPIKQGKLDSTVFHFAPLLKKHFIDELLSIVNQKNQVLHQGLSKCYIPHHCFVFYNKKHEPVASLSVCFMCEAIRTFPSINYDPVRRINSKAEARAKSDLERIKKIMMSANDAEYHEIAFYDSDEAYRQYLLDHQAYQIKFKGDFLEKFNGYSLDEFKDNNHIDLVEDIELNEEISLGGESHFFADVSSETYQSEVHFYGSSEDDLELTNFIVTDSLIDLGFPIQIGMTVEQVNRILIEKSGQDIFSGLIYGQHVSPVITILDDKATYFKLRLVFENSVLAKISL